MSYWALAIYLRAIGRYLDVAAFVDGKPPAEAAESLVGYARNIATVRERQASRLWHSPSTWASDALLMAARYTDAEKERARFAALAEQAFEAGWRYIVGDSPGYVYHNAKGTTMSFTGGGEWMYYCAHPEDLAKPGPPWRAR